MSALWKAEQVCTEVILSIASLLNLQWTFPSVFWYGFEEAIDCHSLMDGFLCRQTTRPYGYPPS